MTKKRIWTDFLFFVVAIGILVAVCAVGSKYSHADICETAEKIRVTSTGQEQLTLQYCAKGAGAADEWKCDQSRAYQRSKLRSEKRWQSFKAVLSGVGGFFTGIFGGGKSGGLTGLAAGPLGAAVGAVIGGAGGAIPGAINGYNLSSHKASADAIEFVLKSPPGVCSDTGKLKSAGMVQALLAALDGVESTKVDDDASAKSVSVAQKDNSPDTNRVHTGQSSTKVQ